MDEPFVDVATRSLGRLGLLTAGERPAFEPLGGGVSSDIWKVTISSGTLCVKRALGRLKVAAVWEAPVERSHFEAEWLRVVGRIRPANVPRVLAEDTENNLILMPYLPPEQYRLWKSELRDGRASPAFAAEVAQVISEVHAATAHDAEIASRFATDASFHAIRLEPYLEATARAHPAVADRLRELVDRTATTRLCLVHGDVSPKNILAGPDGPVLFDAECAWYGDPAFDVAFLLNHLLLKSVWAPSATPGFLACFDAIAHTYLEGCTWEEPADLERRIADLLPALMLARIDGKSPVEYITADSDKERVRAFALRQIASPLGSVVRIGEDWRMELMA